jgi:hypothetical protein
MSPQSCCISWSVCLTSLPLGLETRGGWTSTCEAWSADRKILQKHFFTNSFARSLLHLLLGINHCNMCSVVSLGSEQVVLTTGSLDSAVGAL